MDRSFSQTLSALRRQRNLSQRTAAADLGISQALLSHYENGAREPGLSFVCRACDYYGVTADYLLCRSDSQDAPASTLKAALTFLEQIRSVTDQAELALTEFAQGGTNR
ncbi:MAG: helix-turn-helix transcriptional regulator [Oscillospiraceae bacterium]|nr:helix-turn-helix transcriptional regulator [Oscillospiraceae bacterium]